MTTSAIASAIHSIWHQVERKTDAMQVNSVGCIQLYFRLNRAFGRTCIVEKGHGPLHRPAFPRGNKSSCGRPGACQSKAIWIMAKSWIRLSEPAGKHWEKLQRRLNFARQELPLCGTCNYQSCAQQEGIMARIRWVPNACFKLYAFKALKKILWTWNEDLAHMSLDVGGIAHPPVQWS